MICSIIKGSNDLFFNRSKTVLCLMIKKQNDIPSTWIFSLVQFFWFQSKKTDISLGISFCCLIMSQKYWSDLKPVWTHLKSFLTNAMAVPGLRFSMFIPSGRSPSNASLKLHSKSRLYRHRWLYYWTESTIVSTGKWQAFLICDW